MSFLTVMQSVAKNAGVEPPNSIVASDPDAVLLGQFINEAGQEVARRVDWGVLRKTHTLTGDGSTAEFDLPPDFERFPLGLNVTAGMSAVRGSLTSDEWLPLALVVGTPRYFYLRGTKIAFYPFPRSGEAVRVQYQSKNWAVNGTATKLTSNNDVSVVPEGLLETGAIWRWRRHVGKDFADHVGEFEAQLADLARNDSGVRLP